MDVASINFFVSLSCSSVIVSSFEYVIRSDRGVIHADTNTLLLVLM